MVFNIRTRLTISHLVVILVAMGLSGFLLLSFVEGYFLEAMEESLVAQARITAQALIPGAMAEGPLAEAQTPAYNTVQQQRVRDISLRAENLSPLPVEPSLANLDLSYLTNASLQLSSELDTRIRILDAGGVVLADSQQMEQGVGLAEDPVVGQALQGQYATRTDRTGREPSMYLALPVLLEGRPVGIVYLSQPLRDALTVLHDLRTRWLLSTLIALSFSATVGLLLARVIGRPVHQLTQAAGAVARGQLDHRVPVRSRDELGRLSEAFNEMTARLAAARQMQMDFVANVSHELRTPLTAIKGILETLRDGAVDDAEVRDRFLGTMEGETDRLIRLVTDLLTLSRADSQALNLDRQPVDLIELVQSTTRRLQPHATARGVTLQIDARPDTPRPLADTDRIEQVLLNLLDNAVKFSPPGGVVTVQVDTGPEHTVRVQVRDQGIGVPAAELARIGERFYRTDKARSRAEGGSGLGLAIARALVEAHGGRLVVSSQEGLGTQVSFTLPVA